MTDLNAPTLTSTANQSSQIQEPLLQSLLAEHQMPRRLSRTLVQHCQDAAFPALPSLETTAPSDITELERLQAQALSWEVAAAGSPNMSRRSSLLDRALAISPNSQATAYPTEGTLIGKSKRATVDDSFPNECPPAKKRRTSPRKSVREAIKRVEEISCCICMCEPKRSELSQVNGCSHHFCFNCIEKWADCENTCPLCKTRFTTIKRVHQKRAKGADNSKSVKQRSQGADLFNATDFQSLLRSLSSASATGPRSQLGQFIYSQMGAAELTNRRRVRRTHSVTFAVEDTLWDSDTEEAPPSQGLDGLLSIMMRSTLHPTFGHQARMAAPTAARAPLDPSLGQAANPFEIDDDSDNEDDVEIIQVTRPL